MGREVAVGGPVSVAYRKHRGKWYATALQFDLVGIGETRKKAFEELKVIVETYLESVFGSGKEAEFFNFSEASEWDNSDQEHYQIMALILPGKKQPPLPRNIRFRQISSYQDRVQGFQLRREPVAV